MNARVGMAAAAVWVVLTSTAAAGKPLPAAEVFDHRKVWEAEIRLTERTWRLLQPGGSGGTDRGGGGGRGFLDKLFGGQGRGGGGGGATTQPAMKDFEPRRTHVYGDSYTWVRGDFIFDGKTYGNVGIRYKGASSFSTSKGSLKRPFKVDFDRFVEGQSFHGLSQVNLNNNACDPSQIREAISYWAFREAGVPASRTTFVLLYLTVEGRYDRECIGVYTLVEEVNNDWLKSRFGSKGGTLLKPEVSGIPYMGKEWSRYNGHQPRAEGTPQTRALMMEFLRVVAEERGESFETQIEKVLDVDGFLSHLAVHVMIAHLDSILAIGHNFFLYARPETNRVVWLPWDLNLTWGGYQRMGGWDELMDVAIDRPYEGNVPVVAKLLEVPEYREMYHAHLRRMLAGPLAEQRVLEEIAAMEAAVRDATCRAGNLESGNPVGMPWTPSWKRPPSPGEFVKGRWASARAQLDKVDRAYAGYVPRYRRGGLHGRNVGAVVPPAWAGHAFEAADADGDGNVSADEVVARAVPMFFESGPRKGKQAIGELDIWGALVGVLPTVADASDPAPRAKRQEPAEPIANALLFEGDRDLDGKLAQEEVRGLARRWVRESDLDDDGLLDPQEFGAGLGRLISSRRGN